MSRFLVRLLAFTALPAIALVGYASGGHPYIANRRSYVAKLEDFERRSTAVKFVILGDSHAEAIRPEVLGPSTFNLAEGGDGLTEMLVKAVLAIRRSPGLRIALVSCDYHMTAKHKIVSPKRTFLYPYVEPELRGEVYGIGELERRLVALHPVFDGQFYTFERERLKTRLNTLRAGARAAGGGGRRWAEISPGVRRHIAAGTGFLDHRGVLALGKTRELYARVVDTLRQNRVLVVGIRFPVDAAYLGAITPADRARVDAFHESLGFDRFLDYHGLSSDPEHFADPDHLNVAGARILVERLRRDLGVDL